MDGAETAREFSCKAGHRTQRPATMQLAAYAINRDNNFNLMRFLAAFAVLWSHSYGLALSPENEPWIGWLGYTPGSLAVDVFFITSGFLVTASLLRFNNFKAFARARALRIFPALIVMSLVLGLVLGPMFTTHSLGEYFGNSEVWKFIAKNSTILTGVKHKLPGVFETNPMEKVVNGSLWTLPFELRCYLVLAILWWATKFAKAAPLRSITRMVVIGTALMLLAFWITHSYGYRHWHTFRLFFMFFSGAAFWLLRDRIPMRGWIAVALGVLVLMGVAVPKYFLWIYPLAIAYLVLYLAYVPGGWLRGFNRFGDYSYGVYIYAFPVQQALVASIPGIGAESMFLASALITLPLAMLSWHFVEKPMLARKNQRSGAPGAVRTIAPERFSLRLVPRNR